MPDTTNILNLILLGTGQNREHVQTVLTELAENIEISSSQSMHLIDGIGAKPKSSQHYMLGTYDFDCQYDPHTGVIQSSKKKRSIISSPTSLGAKIRGEGYREAIAEALIVIQKMLAAGKKPLIINVYSFSRGADTGLRLANIVYNLYSRDEVRFNIFGIDPTPGFGRRSAKKARFIPSNVDNYTSTLMKDEHRVAYEAQDQSQLIIQDPKHTRMEFHIYNGVHASAQTFNPKKKDANYASALTYDNIQRFAEKTGTKLKHPLQRIYKFKEHKKKTYIKEDGPAILSDKDRMALYTAMKERELTKSFKFSILKSPLISPRFFTKHLNDYFLHGTTFFHDKQHLLLFRKMYPHFFDYFFQMNGDKSTKNEVLSDIDKINQDSALADHLNKTILAKNPLQTIITQRQLPPPKGIALTVHQLEENATLNHLWISIQNACNLVLSGFDTTIEKSIVRKFKEGVLHILKSDKPEEEKISALQEAALTIVSKCKKQDLFSIILLQLSVISPERTIINRTIASLAEFVNQNSFRLFSKPTVKNNLQRQILIATVTMLHQLQDESTIDPEIAKQVLTIALRNYNKVLSSGTNHSIVKNPIESVLRQSIMDISYLGAGDKAGTDLENSLSDKLTSFENQLNDFSSAVSRRIVK